MRNIVSVSLPENVTQEAKKYCKKQTVTMSEMVRDAVSEYLYRKEIENARRKFTLHVQKLGISSEEELLKAVED